MNIDDTRCTVADPNEWQRARVERGLMRFAPVMPVSMFAGSIAVVVSLWSVTPRGLLVGWFNAGVALTAALWLAGQALNGRWARISPEDRRMRRRWILICSLATGAFWGATGIVLLPAGSPLHQSFLALILAGVTALWLPLFALERRTLLTLAAPALLPMALALLASPSPAAPLATMGSLLLLQLIAFAFVAQVAKRMLDADCATQCALYHQATHDSLVGLVNHAEFRRCVGLLDSAPSGPYALVFIDLDHFKAVNDTAGHGAGDHLLKHIGAILRAEKRKTDVAARVGGDEFAILMELCSDREAMRVARAVLRRINELKLEHDGWLINVTASVGIACCCARTVSAREVLDAADRACYAAKRAGRNRIELAADGVEARPEVRHATGTVLLMRP